MKAKNKQKLKSTGRTIGCLVLVVFLIVVGSYLGKDYKPDQADAQKDDGSGYAEVSPAEGMFHGDVESHVYHGSSCQYYTCKNCTQRFASRQEAEAAGYWRHRQCVP